MWKPTHPRMWQLQVGVAIAQLETGDVALRRLKGRKMRRKERVAARGAPRMDGPVGRSPSRVRRLKEGPTALRDRPGGDGGGLLRLDEGEMLLHWG